jgi:Transposase IS116/IS110/IS902 family
MKRRTQPGGNLQVVCVKTAARAPRLCRGFSGCAHAFVFRRFSGSTATIILAEIRDVATFDSADQLAAFAGLTPHEFSSAWCASLLFPLDSQDSIYYPEFCNK